MPLDTGRLHKVAGRLLDAWQGFIAGLRTRRPAFYVLVGLAAAAVIDFIVAKATGGAFSLIGLLRVWLPWVARQPIGYVGLVFAAVLLAFVLGLAGAAFKQSGREQELERKIVERASLIHLLSTQVENLEKALAAELDQQKTLQRQFRSLRYGEPFPEFKPLREQDVTHVLAAMDSLVPMLTHCVDGATRILSALCESLEASNPQGPHPHFCGLLWERDAVTAKRAAELLRENLGPVPASPNDLKASLVVVYARYHNLRRWLAQLASLSGVALQSLAEYAEWRNGDRDVDRRIHDALMLRQFKDVKEYIREMNHDQQYPVPLPD